MKTEKIPYWQKLQDPRWQKRRLEIMNKDGFRCRQCDSASKTLHVDHRYYVSGREPWDYPDWALKTLCNACHKDEHVARASSDPEENCGLQEWEQAIDFILDRSNSSEYGLWDIAVSIGMATSDGIDRLTLLKRVESAIEELRKQAKQ